MCISKDSIIDLLDDVYHLTDISYDFITDLKPWITKSYNNCPAEIPDYSEYQKIIKDFLLNFNNQLSKINSYTYFNTKEDLLTEE